MTHKEIGQKAEYYFISLLNKRGIPYYWKDGWYDIKIFNQKVEIKSTKITHKFSNKKRKNQQYKIGRFILTEEQQNKDIFLALIIRYQEQYIFLGFISAKDIKRKYLSIHRAIEKKPMTLEEFEERYRTQSNTDTAI